MGEDNTSKGFAGLSSLTSTIDEHTPVVPTDRPANAGPKTPSQPPQKSAKSSSQRESETSSPPQKKPPSEKVGSSGWKWLLGVFAILAIVAVYNYSQRNKSPTRSSIYSPPTTSYGTHTGTSSSQSVVTPKPKLAPAIPKPKITFERPPVGRDNVLSVAQIRWCQREDMRLGVKKPLIDNNVQVAAFNQSVGDYNMRCGSFRYRKGYLERAKREVEKLRAEIEREARLQVQPAVPQTRQDTPTVQVPSSVQPIPSPDSSGPSVSEVRVIQKFLAQLGYAPGPIDGQFGRRTANAIRKFQTDTGRSVTGQVDSDLITALKTARQKVSLISPRNNVATSESAFSVLEAQFFVVLTNKQGKQEVLESNKVPYDTEHSCYGWKVKLSGVPGGTVELQEILTLPSKPLAGWPVITDGSRTITPSLDQKSATTKRTLEIKNSWVSNMWCIGDGDPLGPYSINIFLNKKHIKTFGFDVVEKSAFLTSESVNN